MVTVKDLKVELQDGENYNMSGIGSNYVINIRCEADQYQITSLQQGGNIKQTIEQLLQGPVFDYTADSEKNLIITEIMNMMSGEQQYQLLQKHPYLDKYFSNWHPMTELLKL